MGPRLFVRCLTLLLLAGLPGGPLAAQEPAAPEKPLLRIETGMHTGPIQGLATDALNRYLVTASGDKTVRVWDAASGAALAVLRPPIGAGDQGKVHAVALSPDGGTIACSVYNATENDCDTIYLFRRATGKIIGHISDLTTVVPCLAFSPDGRFLAATVAWCGVNVYRTADYALAANDDYGVEGYGISWARAGRRLRLVTSATDGFVRLYALDESKGVSLRLLAKANLTENARPFDVAFSPDGSRVAVGFDNTLTPKPQAAVKIAVLSGENLATLSEPDAAETGKATNGTVPYFDMVCWSADGSSLYAGGDYSDHAGKSVVREWSQGGEGGFKDIPIASGALWDLVPRRGGGLFFGTNDPAFGVVDADDICRTFQKAETADFGDNVGGLLISRDGATVRFGYESGGKSPAIFSLWDHALVPSDAVPASGLAAPVTTSEGLNIQNWKGTTSFPTLNGKTLELVRFEEANSLAIAPDHQSFLLGADFMLRRFDRNGAEVWEVPAPASTQAVNVSGDGKVAVAAFGDGTIRWYRMTDGQELFALFPHADRRRWVLWAPSGYYDCSLSGGAELVGWQFNRGPNEAADFVPLAHYSGSLHRPDVLAQTLKLRDGAKALRWADALRAKESHRAKGAGAVERPGKAAPFG